MTTLTITFEDQLEQWLQRFAAESGQRPEEVVKDIVRRRVDLQTLRDLQEEGRKYGEQAGVTSDEDVFAAIREWRETRPRDGASDSPAA